MKQLSLANWLKFIIIGMGICGLVICLWVVPSYGQSLLYSYPEFSYCYYPWLIFIWLTAVPLYIILFFSWRVACNIGADHSFSVENGILLKRIGILAGGDSAFFFLGNVVYLLLNLSHPGVTLASLVIVFIGAAISIACSVLSHLIMKAADLQEQSDWTI